MIKQNEIERWLGDKLVYAVLEAFHKKGVKTWHMTPAPRPLEVSLGPTTITLSIDLRSPEHDLAKALKMAPVVKKYVAEVFALPESSFFDVHITDGVRFVLVTVPHPEPWYPEFSEVEDLAKDDLLLGVDMFNQVVYYDMWNAFSSAMVSGMPGAGKTNTMRLIAAQAMRQDWRVFLIAAKGVAAGRDSSEWEDIAPFCERVAINTQETSEVLEYIDRECQARASGKKPVDRGILMIVDELLEMDSDQLKDLGQLLRVRRTAGFRGLLGAKVVGKKIPQDIRASVGFRITHKSATHIESQNATGLANLGAEKLRRGEVVMVDPSSRVTRLVVAKADIEDIAKLLPTSVTVPDLVEETVKIEEITTSQKTEKQAESSLFEQVIEEWKEAEIQSSKGLQAPPVWILARAFAYQQTNSKPPSHKLMDKWHIKRHGKGMTKTRRDMVKQACKRLADR